MQVRGTCRNLHQSATQWRYCPSVLRVSSPTQTWPIVDRRQHLSWPRRLPQRLGTSALWLGSMSLLGPVKLAALLVTMALVAPAAVALERSRRLQRPATLQPAMDHVIDPLPRALVASDLGLAEAELFRARHAGHCIVHHDADGCIVGLTVPQPSQDQVPTLTNAHPVG